MITKWIFIVGFIAAMQNIYSATDIEDGEVENQKMLRQALMSIQEVFAGCDYQKMTENIGYTLSLQENKGLEIFEVSTEVLKDCIWSIMHKDTDSPKKEFSDTELSCISDLMNLLIKIQSIHPEYGDNDDECYHVTISNEDSIRYHNILRKQGTKNV
jgi:hypothetical protein